MPSPPPAHTTHATGTTSQRCTVSDCNRTAFCRGYCGKHYNQLRKHGAILPDRPQVGYPVKEVPARACNGKLLCSVDGCDVPAHRKGYCGAHFMDMWRTGSVKRPPIRLRCRTCGAAIRQQPGGRIYCSQRCSTLGSRYRMTPDVYVRLIACKACEACGAPARYGGRGANSLHIDHDHANGTMRGFLDAACNQALGLAGDSPDILRASADFLRRTPGVPADRLPARETSCCPICGGECLQRGVPGGKPTIYCSANCRHYGSRLRSLGISVYQYRPLLDAQEGRCAACALPFNDAGCRPAIDRSHVTGNIRGITHNICDNMMGLVSDSPYRLDALAAYAESRG